jgi:transcription antitermination factor NusG
MKHVTQKGGSLQWQLDFLAIMNMAITWFALQTKPRNEKQVERLLTNKGYECCLPIYRQKRRWSDRVIEIDLPLFPMYIFCRFSPSAVGRAISTPGVTRIVGFGGQYAEVELEEIKALQLLAQSDLLREPWVYVPYGSLVQVETGPLTGAQGIVCNSEDKRRLVISVTLLQRSVAVQLDEKTIVTVIEGPKREKAGKDEKVALSDESDLALKLMRREKNKTLWGM